jgi:hypothetical protein
MIPRLGVQSGAVLVSNVVVVIAFQVSLQVIMLGVVFHLPVQ